MSVPDTTPPTNSLLADVGQALKAFVVDTADSAVPAGLPTPLLNTADGYVVIPYSGLYIIHATIYLTLQTCVTTEPYPACSVTRDAFTYYAAFKHTLTDGGGAFIDSSSAEGGRLRSWVTYIAAGSRLYTSTNIEDWIRDVTNGNASYRPPASFPFFRKSRVTIRRMFTFDR
jgi:hypothetical protein